MKKYLYEMQPDIMFSIFWLSMVQIILHHVLLYISILQFFVKHFLAPAVIVTESVHSANSQIEQLIETRKPLWIRN